MLRRNGPGVKSVESVLRLEGSLWGETFMEEVGVPTCLRTVTRAASSELNRFLFSVLFITFFLFFSLRAID